MELRLSELRPELIKELEELCNKVYDLKPLNEEQRAKRSEVFRAISYMRYGLLREDVEALNVSNN